MISRSTTRRRPRCADLARSLAAFVQPILAAAACSSTTGPANPASIASLIEYYEVPGVSVAVIRDFELDYVEVHGVKSVATLEPVTEETLFQAASLSKGVSATGVMSLVQQGVVSLDTEVNDYLSSWTLPENSFQNTEKVTLRRLLSHTAGTTVGGFRGYRYTEPVPSLVQILNGSPPANSPPILVDLEPGSRSRILCWIRPPPDTTRMAWRCLEGTMSTRKSRPRHYGRPRRILPASSSSCSCRCTVSRTGS